MKILVVSDSHSDFNRLLRIVKEEEPELVLCLGDYTRDYEELSYVYKDLTFYIVKGNCDPFDRKNPTTEEIQINNKRFFLTHGHLYGVKSSYSMLEAEAKNRGVDVVLFGHTHIPYVKEVEGILYFNPGSVFEKSYGILEVNDGDISTELKRCP